MNIPTDSVASDKKIKIKKFTDDKMHHDNNTTRTWPFGLGELKKNELKA